MLKKTNFPRPRSVRFLLATLAIPLCLSIGCASKQNLNGVALFNQGRYAEALQTFEQAKQSEPANPDTYYNLASTYHRLGNNAKDKKMLENAEALYNQCLDLSPNHVDCHRALAVLLVDTGRSDRAFALVKNWAQRSPQNADARVELARLHQEFNQGKIAAQYLDDALTIDPNNSRAWAERGRMRESSGELMQAVQNYQQSLAINSLQPELYQRIGALNVRLAQGALQSTGNNIIAKNESPNANTVGTVGSTPGSSAATLNASSNVNNNSAALPNLSNEPRRY